MQAKTSVRFLCTAGLLVSMHMFPRAAHAKDIPEFKVHFVVTTNKAGRRASAAALRREVDILNRYFRARDGSRPIRFRFASVTPYRIARGANCRALRMLNRAREHSRSWPGRYSRCADTRVRARDAINILIFDGWTRQKGFADDTSWGDLAGGLPYILLDHERLGHRNQSPEEHEMGHAFGLGHVCVPGAKRTTSTNIMASHKNCSGSGGRRNLGFTPAQVRTILARAALYKKRMAAYAPGRLLQNGGFENRMNYWRSRSRMYSTRSKRTGRFAGLARSGEVLEQDFSPGNAARLTLTAYVRSRCDRGEMGIRVNGRRVSYVRIERRTRHFRRMALRPLRIPGGAKAAVYFECNRGYLVVDDVSLIRLR